MVRRLGVGAIGHRSLALLRALAGTAGLLAAAAATAQGAAPQRAVEALGPPARELRAPHYGDTLFEFYQGHHFDAALGLAVSQHFGRIAPHEAEAELLRAGLLLGWGLHREAGELFEHLLATEAAPSVRDRAWFFLAKIRYQRGLPAEAEAALARIAAPLPPPFEEERTLLRARLAMARADHAQAAALLRALPGQASAVARFNLGVALVHSGDTAPGVALLDELGSQPAADEEQRTLRDRANVALAFAALGDRSAAEARNFLARVRLAGPDSSKALLAYGWAALELGEAQQALVPWEELLARPVRDAAAAEARLAVPHVLAEQGATGLALERYQGALAAYLEERGALDTAIAGIGSGQFVAALLERNPRSGMGWFGGVESLPELPFAAQLAPVLASHEFQEAFKNLHDIVFVGENLAEWLAKLVTYQDMLENRRAGFSERLPRVRAAAGANDLAALDARRRALASELAAAEAGPDASAFAGAAERAQLQRIESARTALHRSGDSPETEAARERLRRVAAVLAWQLAEAAPERIWDARKALRAIDEGLEQARVRDATLLQVRAAEPQRFAQFDLRIQALAQRIAGQLPRVAMLRTEQAAHLQDIAVTALRQQQERLEAHAAQARLAIAQLFDRTRTAANEAAPDASAGRGARP